MHPNLSRSSGSFIFLPVSPCARAHIQALNRSPVNPNPDTEKFLCFPLSFAQRGPFPVGMAVNSYLEYGGVQQGESAGCAASSYTFMC